MKRMHIVYSDEENLTAQTIENAIKHSLPPGRDQIKVVDGEEPKQFLSEVFAYRAHEEIQRLIQQGHHIDVVVDAGGHKERLIIIHHLSRPMDITIDYRKAVYNDNQPENNGFRMRRFQ